MNTPSYGQIARDGLWHNNTGTVQLLGLCPLLACSNSVVTALGLGLATTLALTASNAVVALARQAIPDTIRLPVFVLIIAAMVSTIELLMHAYSYALYQGLGIFIPLIVTNCALLGRAEAFAARHPVAPAAFDGLMIGLGFTWVLVLLGAVRELLGNGTLFHNMHQLFGPIAQNWTLSLAHYHKMLFFILPPGAFIGLGFLIAGKNWLNARNQQTPTTPATPVGSKRVRTTGHIS